MHMLEQPHAAIEAEDSDDDMLDHDWSTLESGEHAGGQACFVSVLYDPFVPPPPESAACHTVHRSQGRLARLRRCGLEIGILLAASHGTCPIDKRECVVYWCLIQ